MRADRFSVRTAAEWYDVHPNTIYRWVKAGKLPARRNPGGKLIFTRKDLEGTVTNANGHTLPPA